MFLFFKRLLASSLAAVSIWYIEHIKALAALTKQCELAGWLAPAFCCKAPAEVRSWQQKAPVHKRVVSDVVDSGPDNGAERWPGLLVMCQPMSTTHTEAWEHIGVQRGGDREDKSSGEGETGGGWLTPASAWVLSMVGIFTIYSGWKLEKIREKGDKNVQVCMHRQKHSHRQTQRIWWVPVSKNIRQWYRCVYRGYSKWNVQTLEGSSVPVYVDCWGINQLSPHMKSSIFELVCLLLMWNNH